MRRRFIKTTSSKLSQFDINNYITIESLEDNLTISASTVGRAYYGIDGIGWNEYESLSEILLNRGQTISFKGNNIKAQFYIDKPCNILGNGYSLLVGDNAVNITDISAFGNNILSFSGCPIINVASSFLPATTLAYECYTRMFSGCTSLTTAPVLPARTLAAYCYENMFSGCTSLTTAPELSATALADYCYERMFDGCTSLTTAPTVLPARTLAAYCYENMFSGCTSLTTAPVLPATILANGCYSYMFSGCTSLTTAPTLPATILATYCYRNMFGGCSKLKYIKMLAINISAINCLYNWVYGVSTTGTFVKKPEATWDVVGVSGVPEGWIVKFDGEE